MDNCNCNTVSVPIDLNQKVKLVNFRYFTFTVDAENCISRDSYNVSGRVDSSMN